MRPSQSLAHAAADHSSVATRLDLFLKALGPQWENLEIDGPAISAARQVAAAAVQWSQGSPAQIAAVSALLQVYANLSARREQAEDGIIAWLARLDESSPQAVVASLLLQKIRHLGDGLDWMCAREIDALCTPESPPPTSRLADFSKLELDALHEIHLSTAPASVRLLAENNPDLTILEADPGRLVALVTPTELSTTPAYVATVVEGVGSAEESSWQRSIDRARSVAQATGAPTVAWIGYRAPADFTGAVHADPARQAGKELARFQRSLHERFPHSHRMIIGYSYGSVVAGHAAQDAAIADDLVLVASPGAGVASASSLQARVWATTNAADPIGIVTGPLGGVHGPDPSYPFFGARPLPGAGRLPGDHSSYWESPAFLRGLGEVTRMKN